MNKLHSAHVAEYYYRQAAHAERHVTKSRKSCWEHLYKKLELMFGAMAWNESH